MQTSAQAVRGRGLRALEQGPAKGEVRFRYVIDMATL